MHSLTLGRKRIAALGLWALGTCLFAFFAFWNIHESELDAENRLITEAGRSAAQLAGLLGLPGYPLDSFTARAIIDGAMEDDHVYAVRVDNNNEMLAGQRRNYMWEPVAWDDELVENCVQGINTLKVDGELAGTVSVWLSPRIYEEETALVMRHELFRFLCFLVLWTSALALTLWNWGDFRRLAHAFVERHKKGEASLPPGLVEKQPGTENESPQLFSAEEGRKYQRRNPDSFGVTAGMFRQTFARGPALINSLYAQGQFAGLCHLGRMLEQAAPCIGAANLLESARNMQNALNDPDCEARALPVEECARALENVLAALKDREQWQRNKTGARSE